MIFKILIIAVFILILTCVSCNTPVGAESDDQLTKYASDVREGMVGLDTINPLDIEELPEGWNDIPKPKLSEERPSYYWSDKNHDAVMSELVRPDTSLSFFARTKSHPKCCGEFSGRSGCQCLSREQIDFINTRGGNRPYGEF